MASPRHVVRLAISRLQNPLLRRQPPTPTPPPLPPSLQYHSSLPPTSPPSQILRRDSAPVTGPENSLEFNLTTVLETLSCYSNDWKRALEFFEWIERQRGFRHSTQTYNRVIDILGKFFEFDQVWNMIEKMRKTPSSMPDHSTFRIVFKRYLAAHLVNEAISTFDKLLEFDLRDELSFSNLIDALCEYKHVIEAEELCFGKNNEGGKYFGRFKIDTKIYNIILRGWFKLSWWSKCRSFWDEMDKQGIKKDLHSYSIMMDIYCKSGKPWRAVKLFEEMKQKRIEPDLVAYNTVLRAIGLSEGVDVAIRLMREMVESGCKPDVVTYNTIIKLLCENGRYNEARKLLDEMCRRGCDPNIVTYNGFFVCLDKPNEIMRLFNGMIQSGIRPRMETYVMLMKKFTRWGYLRPVLMVWKKMEELGVSPDDFAYNALIDALIEKGMIDMARKYDEEMLSKGLSPKARVELGTKMASSEDG